MEQEEDFNQQVLAALDEKAKWITSTEIPKLDENYHMHLSSITNVFQVLEKKSLITPDPYKNDKKIGSISSPDGTDFPEGDRSAIMGMRLSDYQSMIDFVCNYIKFSLDIKMDTLTKLLALNNTILWNSFTSNSPKPNTRNLAVLTNMAKSGAPQLTVSLINENLSISADTSKVIEDSLRDILSYKREAYKGQVRKNILLSSSFDKNAYQSANLLQAEIRKQFPSLMPKIPYSSELVNELIQEEVGEDKVSLRQKVLNSLKVTTEVKKVKKQTVDTHEMIMGAVRSFGGLSEQYDLIIQKARENNEVIQNGRTSFFTKLANFFRQIFNLKTPPIDYEVIITDTSSGAKRKEVIHYNKFIVELTKRSAYYATVSTKQSPGYEKINSQDDNVILDFVNKQFTENNKALALLAGLDEYFKNNATGSDKSKIKGIKMELSVAKNVMQKINQQRADYVAYLEEQTQMKKLGISE